MRLPAIAVALSLAALLAAPRAHAQGIANTSRGFQPPVKQKNLPEYAPRTQPPALPGTLNLAQPADRTATDLGPTESLFDAINRGDIASARDAISRGADLGGRNILGMTPLDLSVDLARNDITFLLLSLHAGAIPSSGPGAKPTTAAAAVKLNPAKPSAKLAAAPARPTAVQVSATAPRPFAGPGDPGTPNPQAGFLGFGAATQ